MLPRREAMSISSIGNFVSGIPFTCGRLSQYLGLSSL